MCMSEHVWNTTYGLEDAVTIGEELTGELVGLSRQKHSTSIGTHNLGMYGPSIAHLALLIALLDGATGQHIGHVLGTCVSTGSDTVSHLRRSRWPTPAAMSSGATSGSFPILCLTAPPMVAAASFAPQRSWLSCCSMWTSLSLMCCPPHQAISACWLLPPGSPKHSCGDGYPGSWLQAAVPVAEIVDNVRVAQSETALNRGT